jgi:hypothetical protein
MSDKTREQGQAFVEHWQYGATDIVDSGGGSKHTPSVDNVAV